MISETGCQNNTLNFIAIFCADSAAKTAGSAWYDQNFTKFGSFFRFINSNSNASLVSKEEQLSTKRSCIL
jgi:hypothetical protein